jgi:hypothetical protein
MIQFGQARRLIKLSTPWQRSGVLYTGRVARPDFFHGGQDMSEPQLLLGELVARFFAAPSTKAADAPAVGAIRRAAFTPEIRAINEKDRTIDFIASTEAVDRYGDILRARGFRLENYKKNPVFCGRIVHKIRPSVRRWTFTWSRVLSRR